MRSRALARDTMTAFLRIFPLFAFALAGVSGQALAQPGKAPPQPPKAEPAAPSTPDEAKREKARQLFSDGVASVQKFQWAEALALFEESYGLVANAITSLNIGVCERALGRYVRATRSLERALAEHERAGSNVLSETSLKDAKAYLDEMARLIVVASVTVRPEGAAMLVDGRPLSASGEGKVAGVEAPGPATAAPAGTFKLSLDPGNHVFLLSRKGFSDAVVNKTFAAGAPVELVFELDKLPATIKVSSAVSGAIVRVGTDDVGPVPVDVARPAGIYPIRVTKDGYNAYETTLTVRAGEEAKINAILPKTKFNIAEQWWFWTSIAATVGTGAVVTYFAVRPEPDPAPFDGGNTGWVVQPSAIRF